MMSDDGDDMARLEAMWRARLARAVAFHRRARPAGLTRPPRDPDERAWLAERGALGPFVEAPPRPAPDPAPR